MPICGAFSSLPIGNRPGVERTCVPTRRGLVLELPPDTGRSVRIREQNGAERDNGCAGGDELERVEAVPDSAHADDRDVDCAAHAETYASATGSRAGPE